MLINTTSGYVGIADTSNEIVFVDGDNGYLYTKDTNTYSQITDSAFPNYPQDVVAFGGRFYVIEADTDRVYYSAINDGTSWNSLNFIRLGPNPDHGNALHVLKGRMYIFGKTQTAVWVLQGGDIPIAQDESLVLEYGSVAPGVVSSERGIMCWVGYDKDGVTSVVASSGGSPQRISSPDVERELQSYQNPEDARAFIYIENGHIFYQINFTDANKSWLYSFDSKTWSRLTYQDEDRHRAQTHVFFNGKRYAGDYALPILYAFDNSYFSDSGVAIKRKWVSNIFSPNKCLPFSVYHIRFLTPQGIGTETGEDKEPVILLSLSRDSGATFANVLESPVGGLGHTSAHTEFYRIGYFEYGTIVLQVEFYNATEFALLNCFIEMST